MATQRFLGVATPVAQVVHLTPAAVQIGDTFTVTINSRTVTYTAAAATVADVVTGPTAYRIYRGTTTGTETYLVQVPSGTSYTDFGTPALSTTALPTTNTAAIPVPTLTSVTGDVIAGSVAASTQYYKITAITAL